MRFDNYMCVECGIAAGDAFPDDPLHTAKLSVVDRTGGEGPTRRMSTICDRCLVGGGEDLGDLLAEIGALSHGQRDSLAKWIRRRSRTYAKEEGIWSRYRRLPATEKAVVEQHLGVKATRSGRDGEVK